jgi:hypothetical protein
MKWEQNTMFEACISEIHLRMLMGRSIATVTNMAGNVRVITLRCVHITIVATEKQ